MPRSLPQLGRVRFHALYRPAGYVSGDIYDASRLDERHLGFYMADAVGHGMPAALLTMFMRQAVQTKDIADNAYRLLKPSETLQRLNERLIEQELSNSTFATGVCGVINAETGGLLLASAGHPRPLVIPAGDAPAYELETDGSLLGIFPSEAFPDVECRLAPGDRLVLYTDGVEVAFPHEPFDPDRPLFDNDRWKREILDRRHESCEHMLLGLSAAIDAQTGSLAPADDLTLLILEMGEK